MSWSVKLTKSSDAEIDGLPASVRQEAYEAITDIGEDPYLDGSIELDGYPGHRRIHFYRGRYRIVYMVSEKQRRVIVTRIRPRGRAYIGYQPPRR